MAVAYQKKSAVEREFPGVRMKTEIRAVIFDLGRVLIDVDFTRGLFRYRESHENRNDQDLLEELFADQTFVDFNTGRITPEETFRSLRERYKLPVDYPTFVREWSNIFSPIEGMPSLLTEVATGYPVGLLSDIDPLHWEYCKTHFAFLEIFKKPALSFEIGALKPAGICYRTAAANIGVMPEFCLFIDDREVNVHGAVAAGMQALQFKGATGLRNELVRLNILKRP
jgi:FMN phosphatase YigB (HAD superfamily)